MAKLRAEPAHCDQVLKLVRAQGLDHLRATRRGDLITLVSGDGDDPFAHARLRRVATQKWRLEMPSHTSWQPTPFTGSISTVVATLIDAFGWTLDDMG